MWGLELPLVVRGVEVSTVTLAGAPPRCYDGPPPGSRVLAVTPGVPLPRGLDVRLVQLGLPERGVEILADGIFGRVSAHAIARYQATHGLPPTGIADVALIAELTAASV